MLFEIEKNLKQLENNVAIIKYKKAIAVIVIINYWLLWEKKSTEKHVFLKNFRVYEIIKRAKERTEN